MTDAALSSTLFSTGPISANTLIEVEYQSSSKSMTFRTAGKADVRLSPQVFGGDNAMLQNSGNLVDYLYFSTGSTSEDVSALFKAPQFWSDYGGVATPTFFFTNTTAGSSTQFHSLRCTLDGWSAGDDITSGNSQTTIAPAASTVALGFKSFVSSVSFDITTGKELYTFSFTRPQGNLDMLFFGAELRYGSTG